MGEMSAALIRRLFKIRVKTVFYLATLYWLIKLDSTENGAVALEKIKAKLPPSAADALTKVTKALSDATVEAMPLMETARRHCMSLLKLPETVPAHSNSEDI